MLTRYQYDITLHDFNEDKYMITEQKASTRSGYFMVFALFLAQLLR